MSDQVDIGHGYTKDGNVIEFVIKKYADGKWVTMDYDKKQKLIVGAGMTPEKFFNRMKRVKLSSAEAGIVNKLAKKELKNPDNVMRSENITWQEIQRALGYNAMGRDYGKVGENKMGITKERLREIIIEEYQKLKEASSDKEYIKAKTFIIDQLANAWELMSPQEMYKHLAKQTKVDKNKLKKLVMDYYKDDKRRNADIMGRNLPAWVGEYI